MFLSKKRYLPSRPYSWHGYGVFRVSISGLPQLSGDWRRPGGGGRPGRRRGPGGGRRPGGRCRRRWRRSGRGRWRRSSWRWRRGRRGRRRGVRRVGGLRRCRRVGGCRRRRSRRWIRSCRRIGSRRGLRRHGGRRRRGRYRRHAGWLRLRRRVQEKAQCYQGSQGHRQQAAAYYYNDRFLVPLQERGYLRRHYPRPAIGAKDNRVRDDVSTVGAVHSATGLLRLPYHTKYSDWRLLTPWNRSLSRFSRRPGAAAPAVSRKAQLPPSVSPG